MPSNCICVCRPPLPPLANARPLCNCCACNKLRACCAENKRNGLQRFQCFIFNMISMAAIYVVMTTMFWLTVSYYVIKAGIKIYKGNRQTRITVLSILAVIFILILLSNLYHCLPKKLSKKSAAIAKKPLPKPKPCTQQKSFTNNKQKTDASAGREGWFCWGKQKAQGFFSKCKAQKIAEQKTTSNDWFCWFKQVTGGIFGECAEQGKKTAEQKSTSNGWFCWFKQVTGGIFGECAEQGKKTAEEKTTSNGWFCWFKQVTGGIFGECAPQGCCKLKKTSQKKPPDDLTYDEVREIFKKSKLYAIPTEMKQPPQVLLMLRDFWQRRNAVQAGATVAAAI